MYLVIGFFGFLAAEFFVIAKVGGWLGGWAAFGLLALGVLAGGFLLNSRRLRNSMSRNGGQGTAGAASLGVLFHVLSGLLFIFPGFISDAAALLLLSPARLPLLALAGHYLTRRLLPRMKAFSFARFGRQSRDPDETETVIEGEFRDVTGVGRPNAGNGPAGESLDAGRGWKSGGYSDR